MTLPLVLEGGAAAEIVETDGTRAVFRSAVPWPPGSTVVGTPPGATRPYRLKVRGCRKVAEGSLPFRIEGRLVELTREQRAAALAATRAAP